MKCKHCNSIIPNDSVFCEQCGAKVKKKSKWLLGICIASIIIAGSILFFLWGFNNNENNEEPYVNTTKDQVIDMINNYNNAYEKNDFVTLSNIYADVVERFHDSYNLTNSEIIEKSRKYDSTFGIISKHTNVRWNTLEVERISPNEISVVYTEDYHIDRKNKSKYSNFVIEKHLILDNNYKIKSIYDIQLEKSR